MHEKTWKDRLKQGVSIVAFGIAAIGATFGFNEGITRFSYPEGVHADEKSQKVVDALKQTKEGKELLNSLGNKRVKIETNDKKVKKRGTMAAYQEQPLFTLPGSVDFRHITLSQFGGPWGTERPADEQQAFLFHELVHARQGELLQGVSAQIARLDALLVEVEAHLLEQQFAAHQKDLGVAGFENSERGTIYQDLRAAFEKKGLSPAKVEQRAHEARVKSWVFNDFQTTEKDAQVSADFYSIYSKHESDILKKSFRVGFVEGRDTTMADIQKLIAKYPNLGLTPEYVADFCAHRDPCGKALNALAKETNTITRLLPGTANKIESIISQEHDNQKNAHYYLSKDVSFFNQGINAGRVQSQFSPQLNRLHVLLTMAEHFWEAGACFSNVQSKGAPSKQAAEIQKLGTFYKTWKQAFQAKGVSPEKAEEQARAAFIKGCVFLGTEQAVDAHAGLKKDIQEWYKQTQPFVQTSFFAFACKKLSTAPNETTAQGIEALIRAHPGLGLTADFVKDFCQNQDQCGQKLNALSADSDKNYDQVKSIIADAHKASEKQVFSQQKTNTVSIGEKWFETSGSLKKTLSSAEKAGRLTKQQDKSALAEKNRMAMRHEGR